MTDVQRRPVKKVRLQQLVSEAGLPVRPNQPPVLEDRSVVTYLQHDSHPQEARDLLLWRRTWDPEYKASSFSSKPRETAFGPAEVHRAVKQIIDQSGSSLGLVEALLDIARDGKASVWGKIRGKEQQVLWTELISDAIRKQSYDMVRLLASRSDEKSLNSALPFAIRAQDTRAVRVLLERGADLNEYHADFQVVMVGPNADLAEVLILAPRPPCLQCRSASLVTAVQKNSLQLTGLLVQRGVDAEWKNWEALRFAIQGRSRELVLAIVSGPQPPAAASLDGALGFSYSAAPDLDFAFKVAEILLCAGAQGENTDNVLALASGNKQVDLVDLLVSYGASPDFRDGEAIRNAVVVKDNQLLVRLLRGKPSGRTLASVLGRVEETLLGDLTYCKDTLSSLLSAGLRGQPVDQFLQRLVLLACSDAQDPVVHMDSLGLISMLVEGDYVDLNFNSAASLRAPAGTPCLDVLRILLGSKKPLTADSLSGAFSETAKIRIDNPVRLEILAALLDAGASGVVVNQALVNSVQHGRRGDEEARLLLSKGASVDYLQGAALNAALARGDPGQLDMLLERGPSASTICSVWDFAARLDDLDCRHEIFKRLLSTDASAAPLDRELVSAVSRGGSDSQQICALLLDHGAQVDANGLALTAAVKAQNMEGLQLLLLRQQPPASALRTAAQSVWLLSGTVRIAYAQVLLSYSLEQSVRDTGLLAAVSEEHPDEDLVALLLDHGASPEYMRGEAVAIAAGRGDERLMTRLIDHVSNAESLTGATSSLLGEEGWATQGGLSLLGILLSRGATCPLLDLAFIKSCSNYTTAAWNLLIPHVGSDILTTSLLTIVTQDAAWRSAGGLVLVEALVSHGAAPAILRPAFVQAASVFSLAALRLLQPYAHDLATIAWNETTLLQSMGHKDAAWVLEEVHSVPVLEALLSCGARADINFALVQAVALSATLGHEPLAVVDLLLHYGANPCHFNGQPVRLAARNGCAGILTIFCQGSWPGLSADLLQLAFFDVLTGEAREDTARAVACVRALAECRSARLDLNSAPDGTDLPLIQILSMFPQSAELVELAIQAGAHVDSVAVCPLLAAGPDDWRSADARKRGEKGPAGLHFTEHVPALEWALMRPNVADSVISVLIDKGADVNFFVPRLGFTPLILAAKQGREGIISHLLRSGARPDATDNWGNTALAYACRQGHSDCVKCLLQYGPTINDGSLHEAARGLKSSTVELLVRAGYDANSTSHTHGNRTPLGELCLLADGKQAEPSALADTLRALAAGGADPLRASGDPTMQPIFLAFANSKPRLIVEKLIEVSFAQTPLSSPRLMFQQDGLVYSPTSYLKKLVLPLRPSNKRRVASAESQMHRQQQRRSPSPYPDNTTLDVDDEASNSPTEVSRAFHLAIASVYNDVLGLLSRHGATDRFYYTGADRSQPADAVGSPTDKSSPSPQQGPGYQSPDGGGGLLHQLWGGSSGVSSPVRATSPTINSQQHQDRRVLAELVDRHLAQHAVLAQAAEKLRREAESKVRMDRRVLLTTEWLAGQMALADRLGGAAAQQQQQQQQQQHQCLLAVQRELSRAKQAETMDFLAASRQKRLQAHDKALEEWFIDPIERQVAMAWRQRVVVLPVGEAGRSSSNNSSSSPAAAMAGLSLADRK